MPELTPEAQRCVDAAVSFAREIIEPQAEGWERNGGTAAGILPAGGGRWGCAGSRCRKRSAAGA